MQSGTVLGTLPRALIAYAESVHRIASGDLYAAAGITAADLADPDARVPRKSVDALWEAVEVRSGDGSIGVHFAHVLPPGNAGVLGYILSSSATVGEAWEHTMRYWRLLNEDAEVRLARGDELRISVRAANGVHFHRQWNEFTVAVFALSGKNLAADRHAFTTIALPHSRRPASAVLEALVGTAVRYEHEAIEIGIPGGLAALPLPSANPALRDLLRTHADAQLALLPARSVEVDVRERARTEIERRLQHGDASLEGVARALGMSGRTLQRHLNALGTSHRELLDEARSAVAVKHLGGAAMSVTDVAFVLGFSEVSAFHRAFRRWTGMGPSEFRATRRS